MPAGAFHIGVTTRCQCMKPLLHPEQAIEIGNRLGKRERFLQGATPV